MGLFVPAMARHLAGEPIPAFANLSEVFGQHGSLQERLQNGRRPRVDLNFVSRK
ncbi:MULTISPECIES: hypothetical protein [unclassified Ensifer]|uniref:hypothetical protein n=1 Tax=unclassified Ensifer TaxID=2633371 RepID=UPI00137A35E0|nr:MULTISPECIES: hypothetical protein [unclassified Ensifer]